MKPLCVHKIHDYCSYNKLLLQSSTRCGCFDCLRIFNPKEVKEWIDTGQTALCPYCGTDMVLPESCNYKLNKKLLMQMQKYWKAESLVISYNNGRRQKIKNFTGKSEKCCYNKSRKKEKVL